MKILHIAPTPFFSDRGCHIRILSILQALTLQGGSNILCTYPLGRNLPGIDIRRIGSVAGYQKTEAGPQKGKLAADLKLLFLSIKIAFSERPDAIHAHLHEGVLIGWLVRWILFWRGIPLVADLQGSLVGELSDHGFFNKAGALGGVLRTAFRTLEWFVLRLPAHSFCSSGNSERIFLKQYHLSPTRLSRLDDMLDLDAYDPAKVEPANYQRVEQSFVVAYSGSLLPIKGLDVLKQVMLSITERRRDISFLLIGYPTDEIEHFLSQQGIKDRVTVVGRVAFETLPSYLLLADAGIEPKQSVSGEGSGKLLHYMAAGLALAAFPSEHNRELAGAEALASGNTSAALVEVIEQLADNRGRCKELGNQNRQRVQPYSLHAGGAIIARVYKNIGIAQPT